MQVLSQSCCLAMHNQLLFYTRAKSAVLFTLAVCEGTKPVNVELQFFERLKVTKTALLAHKNSLGAITSYSQRSALDACISECRSPFRVDQ